MLDRTFVERGERLIHVTEIAQVFFCDARHIGGQVAPQAAADHLQVHRPWGSYQSLDLGERYQVKRIVVKQGERLSLQLHHHRAEHWVVVRGTARVTIGDNVQMVHENESI